MKIKLGILGAFLLLAVGLGADERTAVWERLYKVAVNDEMRYGLMLNIVELKDKTFTPILSDSLAQLLARQVEKGDLSEVKIRLDLVKMIVRELGNLRALEAEDVVFQTYQDVTDTYTRAEAIVALGRMRAVDKAPALIKHLGNINLVDKRYKDNEILAFSLVNSLDLMKSQDAFESLFYASIGWYSEISQVRNMAKAAIKNLVPDPSEPLGILIKSKNDFTLKFQALTALENANTSKANRAKGAIIGLEEGNRWNPTEPTQIQLLGDIRKKAMNILIASGDKSVNAVPALAEALRRANAPDLFDEARIIYRTLGVNGTDDAAKVLASELRKFNELKMKSVTIRTDDDQRIRDIISAMKVAKNKTTVTDLKILTSIPQYTPALQTEARAVIKEIESANP